MAPDLPSRARQINERIKLLPESSFNDQGAFLKRDAYTAFLDLRQMLEREIIPALDEAAKK